MRANDTSHHALNVSTQPPAPAARGPGLRLTGSVWRGGVPLFDKLDFQAKPGQWTALLGRSGAGKTTIIKALAGLLDTTSSAAPSSALRAELTATADDGAPIEGRAAWMAQDDLMPPWATALETALLGPRLRGAALDAALKAQGAEALAAVGLGDRLTACRAELSGGERQRVALARTLLENRPIALLDEPFSALDAATRAELQELTFEKLTGRTVILVTHDPLEAARLAHEVQILRPGGKLAVFGAQKPALLAHPHDSCATKTLHLAAELTTALRRDA